MKSAIYTAMTSATTVAVDGTLPLGTVIRRFGCNCQLSGNGISITGAGYYDTNISVTLLPTAVGNVTVTLSKDGVAIQGATATTNVTAANTPVTLSFPALIRLQCCETTSNLTYVLTGTESSVTNVGVVVEKI